MDIDDLSDTANLERSLVGGRAKFLSLITLEDRRLRSRCFPR